MCRLDADPDGFWEITLGNALLGRLIRTFRLVANQYKESDGTTLTSLVVGDTVSCRHSRAAAVFVGGLNHLSKSAENAQ
jgi:hypothetical protein